MRPQDYFSTSAANREFKHAAKPLEILFFLSEEILAVGHLGENAMSDNDNTTDPEPIPDPVDPNDTTTPGTNLVFTDDQGATTTINTDTGESQGTVGVGGGDVGGGGGNDGGGGGGGE